MLNSTGNSAGTFQNMGGEWLTKNLFPLRIIALSYLGPHDEITERRINVLYNDGMLLSINHDGLAGLMSHDDLEPYQESIGNILLNEQEHWFADKNPCLSDKVLM